MHHHKDFNRIVSLSKVFNTWYTMLDVSSHICKISVGNLRLGTKHSELPAEIKQTTTEKSHAKLAGTQDQMKMEQNLKHMLKLAQCFLLAHVDVSIMLMLAQCFCRQSAYYSTC